MRILQIIAGVAPDFGGPAFVARQLSAALAHRGHQVDVFTTDAAGEGRYHHPPGVVEELEGYATHFFHALHPGKPMWSPGLLAATARRAGDYDAIHVHGIFNVPASGAMAILRAQGRPYVSRPCGALDGYALGSGRRVAKRAFLSTMELPNLRAARAIQVSSRREARALAALGLVDNVALAPQGVATAAPATGAGPESGPYFLFLGRLAREKGLELMVRAFAGFAPADAETKLVLAGPDEHHLGPSLRQLAAELGVADRLVFPGMVGGPEKARWLKGAQALVLASHTENFGLVLVEAAAQGTPAVVTDTVGLAEEVARHGAGIVVPRQLAPLTEALGAVLERRDEFAARALDFAAVYSWERAVERIEALYQAPADPGGG